VGKSIKKGLWLQQEGFESLKSGSKNTEPAAQGRWKSAGKYNEKEGLFC
jgi:hypothetical protein